jgi:hypothetical protein
MDPENSIAPVSDDDEQSDGSTQSWYEEDGFVTNSKVIETFDKGENLAAEISSANIVEGKRKRQKTVQVDIWKDAEVNDDFNLSEYEEAAVDSPGGEEEADDSDVSWKEGDDEGDEGEEGEEEEEVWEEED